MKVAPLLYNTAIRAYASGIKLAASFHTKARLLNQGQQGALAAVEKRFARERSPRLWFHCASLGEFEQGRPLMEALKEEYPHYRIVLTFFSPSGYEVRKNYAGADFVCYLPLDTPENARRFLVAVQPEMAFFIKYEFWHNYLRLLHKRQIPTFLISGIFRPQQLFFKRGGGFYRQMLHSFTHLFVQNEESVKLLQSIGVKQVTLSGDTRFDRVAAICKEPKKIPQAEIFQNKQPLLVAGSSWEPDLKVLAPLLQLYKGRLKCIVAPHEVDEEHLQQAERLLEMLQVVRFSRADNRTLVNADVLLIDNVGMLSALYALADYAYIGGSFGKGLHNILEAATFGVPLFFGNKQYGKFQEAVELVEGGSAFTVADAEELKTRFCVLFEQKEKRKKAARAAADYVQWNTGATRKIMEYINKMVEREHARQSI